MRCRLLIGLAIGLTLTCCLVNASCAMTDDAGACTRANGDERIDACTRIILSNKSSDGNLAWAYRNRGWSWHLKHDEDRAIADFTTSIKLDPKIALAYEDRAAAYFASKNYDRALSDYNDATRLDPSYIDPYIGRGNVYRNKHD